MAFGDFKTISEVLEKFRIVYAENDFFKVEDPSHPSEQFLQDFEFCREHIDVLRPKQQGVRRLSFRF